MARSAFTQSFVTGTFREVHTMWHAGATRQDVIERINDRVYAYWWNTGHRGTPPRRVIWAFRWFRRQALACVYGPRGCREGYLDVCPASGHRRRRTAAKSARDLLAKLRAI